MRFRVLPVGQKPPDIKRERVYLLSDNWNDWFKYQTQYTLIYVNGDGEHHTIGDVKIGQFGMTRDQGRPNLPSRFEVLDEIFYSLGQDDSYYENLNKVGDHVRDSILFALRDIAANLDLFERSLKEDVTGVSLLRYVSPATVRGQFHRLAQGGLRLSQYHFHYIAPKPPTKDIPRSFLSFDVVPDSQPPTNIHVLIGRNGVGKTTLLHQMTRALVETDATQDGAGYFETGEDFLDDSDFFSNLVSVTFSAFDPFEPLSSPQNKSTGLQYSYIGLKRIRTGSGDRPLAPKTHTRLAYEFSMSVNSCIQGARFGRWRRALEMLEADPIFKDEEITSIADEESEDEELKMRASSIFSGLSSGHKIVLLTITRLVETVEERSLVLFDEPEAHLHPPLLSAFVRALSDLLINRNGVAIIATHSPVVLQEVPQHCVWKIRRNGQRLDIERPEIETFGENVGILTREVFGLEVTQSGFHRLIRNAVENANDYNDIISQFDENLGGEARAIARALIASRDIGDFDVEC